MSEKRFTIKPQDDYWAVVDNHNEDKVCIINGIHTEIEAEWLCDFMNDQQDQINSLIVDKHILVDNIDKARLYIKAKDRHIKHQQATIDKLDQQCADFLGDKIKALEEFEECTDKLKAKILEQQSTIQELEKRLEHYTKVEAMNGDGRMAEYDLGKIDGLDDYIEKQLAEKDKIIDEQQTTIEKQNELIKLIANACTYSKEHSVKEILRKTIKGIDTVTYESAGAWHDYGILSEFFKEHYKEHWDNE